MDLLEKIIKAKEVIGDKAAFQIAEHYHVEKFDEKNLKGCCPFHHEDTPSFIWNKKDKYFHCYGCSRKVGLLDMYIETEGSYNAALKRLFNEAGIEYDDKDLKVDRESYFDSYRFPREEPDIDKTQVYEYYSKRGISKETIDYVGVKQDKWGNAVFELRDLDGELLAVKYRPSHKIQQGQAKMWWQKDADTCPSLFNIDKVDITKPVLIVEGYSDVLAVVEAGFHNVVSIPGGAEDLNWIEFNYDILEKIPQVYLWFDNDVPGETGRKRAQQRIGEYKCKIVKPDKDDKEAVATYYELYGANCHKTDANNVLLACGKDRIIWLIDNAEEIPVENLVDLMTAEEFDIDKTGYNSTGISELDKQIYGYIDGTLNIWTAYAGCVDCDTEFFNGKEWKKISEWDKDDKVLQYNEDGTTALVTPIKYHKYECDNLWHFKTKYGLNQCLSDEHTVVYLSDKGNICKKQFSELKKVHEKNRCGFSGWFIRTFDYSGDGIDLSDEEIELMCAVICDGSFSKNNTNFCRLHLKKERKKERIIDILNRCGVDYKFSQSSAEGYTDFYFHAPRKEKEFSEYWYNCNKHQLKVISENILFWDGNINETKNGKLRRSFSTTSKKTADFVQFLFSCCGFSASISINDRSGQEHFTCGKIYIRKSAEYTVTISERKTSRMISYSSEKTKIEPYKPVDGFKYCFTVPSHMWVMRRGGRIVITGNCGKSTLIGQTCVLEAVDRGETVFWFNAESTTSQMLNWILAQAAGRYHSIEFKRNDGFYYYKPTQEAAKMIKKKYTDKIFVYDNLLLSSAEDVLDKMKYIYMKRGTKVFVLDNWMCLNFRGVSDSEITGLQVDFMNKLIHFAKKYDLQIHLVAHPRKPQANMPLTEYDILGTSNIINMADRIFGLEKVWDEELKAMQYDRQLTVFKDRILGVKGQRIGLYYDKVTRRLYSNNIEKYKKYNWDDGSVKYQSERFGSYGLLVGERKLDCDIDPNDIQPPF